MERLECDFGRMHLKRESGPPKAEAPASLAASACMVHLGHSKEGRHVGPLMTRHDGCST